MVRRVTKAERPEKRNHMAKTTKQTKTTETGVFVQLATRVPKGLHRAVKLHCAGSDESMMDYVIRALESALPAKARKAS